MKSPYSCDTATTLSLSVTFNFSSLKFLHRETVKICLSTQSYWECTLIHASLENKRILLLASNYKLIVSHHGCSLHRIFITTFTLPSVHQLSAFYAHHLHFRGLFHKQSHIFILYQRVHRYALLLHFANSLYSDIKYQKL